MVDCWSPALDETKNSLLEVQNADADVIGTLIARRTHSQIIIVQTCNEIFIRTRCYFHISLGCQTLSFVSGAKEAKAMLAFTANNCLRTVSASPTPATFHQETASPTSKAPSYNSPGRHGLPREEEGVACFADGTQPATEAATHTRTWKHRDIALAYRRPPDIAHTCRSAHSAPYRPKSFGELKQ